jgi:hypothetical protein
MEILFCKPVNKTITGSFIIPYICTTSIYLEGIDAEHPEDEEFPQNKAR